MTARSLLAYVNGAFVPADQPVISAHDYGFLYGDGVFEGIRVYDGRPFKLPEHLRRLIDSQRIVGLRATRTVAELSNIVQETCAANQRAISYLRLTVTRGPGPIALDPTAPPQPTIVCLPAEMVPFPPSVLQHGLRVIVAATRRTSPSALSPRAKTLNYLNNAMAKLEALHRGAGDALMLGDHGFVTEASSSNVFVLSNGALRTPPPSAGILLGITRDVILSLAHDLGVPAKEEMLTRDDLYTADECFLTGTASEIVPVIEIDSRPVGPGAPGPLTGRLAGLYRELTRSS